jgi:hypothetical protein
MSKRQYGMIAGIAGAAAFAAWWMRSRRSTTAEEMTSEDRGELIFSNSPDV